MIERLPNLGEIQNCYGEFQNDNVVATNLEGVRLFWFTTNRARVPTFYQSGMTFVFQGRQSVHLADQTLQCDPNNYIVSVMPIPFESTVSASSTEPLIGVTIDIRLPTLYELVEKVNKHTAFDAISTPRGIESVPIDQDMRVAGARLFRALMNPIESDVLGDTFVREIYFRALMGPYGYALYALTQRVCYCSRIAKSLSQLNENFEQPFTVEQLAEEAAMSVSTFHRAFKHTTGDTPLQYLKKLGFIMLSTC